MNSIREKAKEHYTKAALKHNEIIVEGRYTFDADKDQSVIVDIINKLDIKNNQSILDIGCGFGFVTESLIDFFNKKKLSVTLMDIPEIIDAVQQEIINEQYIHIHLVKGLFPQDFSKTQHEGFDRILFYSVLHYLTDPFDAIDQAVSLLNPYGRLFIGDIPNISKKGRFLSSTKGKLFDAEYKKVNVADLPEYKTHFDFVNQIKNDPKQNSLLDDTFINKIIDKYSNSGYDVYLLNQPEALPFCYTREDILICKYD